MQPIDINKRIEMNKSIGKGVCFTVINAGSEEGFINNAEKIIYKTEINAEIFENRFENQLMPNVPPFSVIIFDNCSVHATEPQLWHQI